jgi:hypothetical protein
MSKTPRTDAVFFALAAVHGYGLEDVRREMETLELELSKAESDRNHNREQWENEERENGHLRIENLKLKEELEKVKGERDEALADFQALKGNRYAKQVACLQAALSALRARLSYGVKGRIIEAGNLESTGKPGLLIESTVDELRGKAWIGECVVLKETGKDGV